MKFLSVFIGTLVVIAAVHAQPQRRHRDVGYAKTNGNGAAAKSNGNGAAAKSNGNGYSNGAPKNGNGNGNGYPKENPANPLKLDGAAATNVEVRADSTTTAAPMMMGGEIPGNAGVDYPIFDTVPETSFSCKDQKSGGYFADVDEGRCQVFHVCHDERKFSFLCPNGTIFDQKVFVCNWWFNVDCAASKDFYDLNAAIGVVPEKTEPLAVAPSIVDTVSSPDASYLPPNGNGAKTTNGYSSNGPAKTNGSNGASKTNGSNGSTKTNGSNGKNGAAAAAAPATSYLPPTNGNGKPSTQASTADAVPVPAQSYLAPPVTGLEVSPNAAEAIVNGIITSTAKAPAQGYLPPNSGY